MLIQKGKTHMSQPYISLLNLFCVSTTCTLLSAILHGALMRNGPVKKVGQ